jgi:pimeloyl-ACP methyl ester carboxylesterase
MTGDTRPALVLLHGATCNGRMWDAIRRDLDSRLQVITPDLPGHGSRRDEPFTLQGAIDTVVTAVNSLPGIPVVVGGDSLGGYTALASAASLPQQQLKALILAGSSSNLSGFALLPYLRDSALLKLLIRLRGEDKVIASTAPKLVSEMHMRPEDAQAMVDAGMSLRVFPQAVAALRGVDFRAKVAAVDQPILFINGTKDSGHMRQEPSFLAVARNASAEHIEDCKHGVTIRRSAACAVLINRFAVETLL